MVPIKVALQPIYELAGTAVREELLHAAWVEYIRDNYPNGAAFVGRANNPGDVPLTQELEILHALRTNLLMLHRGLIERSPECCPLSTLALHNSRLLKTVERECTQVQDIMHQCEDCELSKEQLAEHVKKLWKSHRDKLSGPKLMAVALMDDEHVDDPEQRAAVVETTTADERNENSSDAEQQEQHDQGTERTAARRRGSLWGGGGTSEVITPRPITPTID